jgi:hypothetical protein
MNNNALVIDGSISTSGTVQHVARVSMNGVLAASGSIIHEVRKALSAVIGLIGTVFTGGGHPRLRSPLHAIIRGSGRTTTSITNTGRTAAIIEGQDSDNG